MSIPMRDPVRLPREIVEAFRAGAKWMRGVYMFDDEIERAAENYAWTGDPENDTGP